MLPISYIPSFGLHLYVKYSKHRQNATSVYLLFWPSSLCKVKQTQVECYLRPISPLLVFISLIGLYVVCGKEQRHAEYYQSVSSFGLSSISLPWQVCGMNLACVC
jgi:hypothetical protein